MAEVPGGTPAVAKLLRQTPVERRQAVQLHGDENACGTGSQATSYVSDIAADQPSLCRPSRPALASLRKFLLSLARTSADRHPGVGAAMAAIEANPSIRMAEVRELAGLSTKRFVRLFRTEVGLSPKEYARVRRLQAALRQLGAGNASGADIAAGIGYFDQSHFVREFRSFTGMTLTQYERQRILLPSHVPVDRHKYPRPLR
jgi:AraC-like DNA-binding protein